MSDKLIALPAIALTYTLTTWVMPFIIPGDVFFDAILDEDRVIEYASFIFLFLAGVVFFTLFWSVKSGNQFGPIKTPRNLAFLLLALVMIFGAGEEISWGQRILGFDTAEIFKENIQEETTIHNLPIFDSSLGSLFQMNRLFIYFWFGFGILIPLGDKYSERLSRWGKYLGVPVAPIWLGGIFLLNYALSKIYYLLDVNSDVFGGRLSEIRESQQALVFLLIGIYFWYVYVESRQPDSPEPNADGLVSRNADSLQ